MNSPQSFIEIEIKVQIENSKQLLNFLREKGQFTGEKHQIDTYYSPAHRDFIKIRPVKEWLRIRNSSGKYSINYKNWHFDENNKSQFCDEYETLIEDIKHIEKILRALDMKLLVKVDKKRQTWTFQDYEIAIDSIKGLGNFIEIEYKGENQQKKPAEIIAEMINFLKQFNCGKIMRNYVGYPFQLLFPEEVQIEEV